MTAIMKCWGFPRYMYSSFNLFSFRSRLLGQVTRRRKSPSRSFGLGFARTQRGSPGHQIALPRVKSQECCNDTTQGELKNAPKNIKLADDDNSNDYLSIMVWIVESL